MKTFKIETEYRERSTGKKGKKVFTLKREKTQGALFVVYTWAINNNADVEIRRIREI